MLSELAFGAYLAYVPRGNSKLSRNAKAFVQGLKQDRLIAHARQSASHYVAAAIAKDLGSSLLGELLAQDAGLVPVPRCSLLREGDLWPAQRIAEALLQHGIGQTAIPCLERVEEVPKSSFSEPEERPSATRHYETMAVTPITAQPPSTLILVDDVVTRGATLIGAASRLVEAFPECDVRGFAVVRARSFDEELSEIVDPCAGSITFYPSGKTFREP